MSAQPGLFLGAAGAALSADFIAADVEQDRIAHIRALPLAPFQFGAFEGTRRVASFGWRYDYGQHKLEQAEEIPAWLAPLSAKVESFAALPDSAVRQVLFTEYEAGVGIGWHRESRTSSTSSDCRSPRPANSVSPQGGRVGAVHPRSAAALALHDGRGFPPCVGAQHPCGRCATLFLTFRTMASDVRLRAADWRPGANLRFGRCPAMNPLNTAKLARLLREFGQRSSLRGGNPYRGKAYARAAESLGALAQPLDPLIAEGRLQEIPGVGAAIADIITKLHRTGTHPSLESMRKDIPEGVLEMLSVPGLRPDKVLKLYNELGITSLAGLEAAARAGSLKGVKGLGPALQAKILRNIEIGRSGEGRRHMHRAALLLESAERSLRQAHPDLIRVTCAGDFRRGCELVADLALVAEAPALASGPATLNPGGALSVHLTDKQHYGAALLFATGSARHIEELQALAQHKGLALSADGLKRGRKTIAARGEDDIYKALGLPFIAPELREGRDEIERALAGTLPELVRDHEIRGILHAHTDLSDGVDTLAVMAEATRARGYQYFGVADHSKSAHYAGGLSVDEVIEQHRAIDRLNKTYDKDFRILKGIESDILADGALDYSNEVLDRFDFVVASVHSHFKLDRKVQTERIIRAVENPHTTILGHMTGRQLLRRPGYDIDIETILSACAAHGVAIEINANPWRLDLDWRWHQRALDLGCMMSINPDAHSTREIDLMHWGVEMARKGGVPASRVLNCLTLHQLLQHLRKRKRVQARAA